MSVLDLAEEVRDLGQMLGLLDEGGSLSPAFFDDPVTRVRRVVSDPVQRAALLRTVRRLLPADDGSSALPPPGPDVRRATHPLIDSPPAGQLYLVVDRSGPAADPVIVLSLAGVAAPTGVAGSPAVVLEVPLVRATGPSLVPVSGTPEGPIRLRARLDTGWTRPERPIDLASVELDALLVGAADPSATRFALRLVGLDVGQGRQTVTLDPGGLADGAGLLVSSLLAAGLSLVDPGAPPALRLVVDHLPDLLGIAGPLPPLPFSDLVRDGLAMRGWLADLATGTLADGRNALAAWLDEVAGLLGAPAPALSALPTGQSPAEIVLVTAGSSTPEVALTVGVRDSGSTGPVLVVGLRVRTEGQGSLHLVGGAVLLAVPLTGTRSGTVLESAYLVVETTGLLPTSPSGLAVGSMQGGLEYDGDVVRPLLELRDVDLPAGLAGVDPAHLAVLDLTDASALTAAAAGVLGDAVRSGIAGAAGDETADALLDLLGLGPSAPVPVVLEELAAGPTRALAAYARAVLESGPATAQLLVRSVWRLLTGSAVPTPDVAGTGTPEEPWRLPLASSAGSSLSVDLLMWDAPSGTSPHRLRLALACSSRTGTAPVWDVEVRAQLLALDLAPSGAAPASLLDLVTVTVSATELPAPTSSTGLGAGATALRLAAHWRPGERLTVSTTVEDVTLSGAGSPLPLGTVVLPTTGPLDLSALDGRAVEALLLLGRRALVTAAGPAGDVLADLLVVEGDLATVLGDPVAALRAGLAGMVRDQDGAAATAVRTGLAGLLSGLLPPVGDLPLPEADALLRGAGTRTHPWELPLESDPDAGNGSAALVWLEPDGPPAAWAGPPLEALAAASPTGRDLVSALSLLGALLPDTVDQLRGHDLDALATDLDELATSVECGDGIVPLSSAIPPGAGWRVTPPVAAGHSGLPTTPEAVAAVRAEVAARTAGPAPWVVVYLSSPSGAASTWDAVLDGVPSDDRAVVDLRVQGDRPGSVDLTGLRPVRHYAVDLVDDGLATLTELVGQLDRVITRIRQVHDGEPKAVLVAHSTSGRIAEAYAAQRRTRVHGIVTLGTPFEPVEVPVHGSTRLQSALRFARDLPRAADAEPGVLGALDDLAAAVAAGDRFPADALARTGASPDLAGVPALAVPALVPTGLLATLARGAAGAASARGAQLLRPTHLAAGFRADLPLGAAEPGDPEVTASIRVDAGSLALDPGAPAAAPGAAEVRVSLTRPGGWLVGGPGPADGPLDPAVRAADLLARLTPGSAEVDVRLHSARLSGEYGVVLGLDDPRTGPLLQALLDGLDAAAPAAGRVARLLDQLATLGLLTRRSGTTAARVPADALAALRRDPAAYVAPRLAALLDTGFLGFARAPGPPAPAGSGPWVLPLEAAGLQVTVTSAPWRITVATPPEGTALTDDVTVAADVTVTAGTLATSAAGRLAVGGLTVRRSAGTAGTATVTVEATPLLPETQVWPLPAAGDLEARLREALAPLLPGTILSALLEELAGGLLPVRSLLGLVRDPGAWLSDALGDGVLPRADAVDDVLAALATALGDLAPPAAPRSPRAAPVDRPTLALPGGLGLSCVPRGDGLALRLSAAHPEGAAGLSGALELVVDRTRTVTPSGALDLTVPLPGPWGPLTVSVGVGPAGVRLTVRPAVPAVTVSLLPRVQDVDRLLAAFAEHLLSATLDRLVGELEHSAGGPPAALPEVLAVAQALELYDPARPAGTRFDGAPQALRDLRERDLTTVAAAAATAAAPLLQRLVPAGALLSTAGGVVTVETHGVLGGTVLLRGDLSSHPPGLSVECAGLTVGAVSAAASVSCGPADPSAEVRLGIDVDTTLGFRLRPELRASTGPGGSLAVTAGPLGLAQPPVLQLAPDPQPPTAADLGRLVTAWVVPLGAWVLVDAARSLLDRPLWTPDGGAPPPTARTLLRGAGVLVPDPATPGVDRLADQLPGPGRLAAALAEGLRGLRMPVAPTLSLSVATDGQARIGFGLAGTVDLPVPVPAARLDLQAPPLTSWPPAEDGVAVLLLDLSGPEPVVRPALRVSGAGLSVTGAGGSPLVDTRYVRVGSIAAHVRTVVELSLSGQVTSPEPPLLAVDVRDLGLPFATGDGAGNPVAAALLQPAGAGGDAAPANPPLDLMMLGTPGGPVLRLNGSDSAEPVYVGVHRTFGPLHLEQIGFGHRRDPARGEIVGIAVDASVSVGGLEVQTRGLTVRVPLRTPTLPGTWELDLEGLAASLTTPAVSLAGGLVKNTQGGQVTYDGMLAVTAVGRSFTALGSYARPVDSEGSYTSLFVFVTLPVTLGGPPYLFVLGLAGGVGINRKLLVPSDPVGVPGFPLVKALEGGVPTHPMQALKDMGTDMPPSRGSFWVAAGVRFTTFGLLHTKALAYVVLDRGVEVGLLGLMQMALPAASAPLVSVELALAARYSSREQVLSVRAALTNNSWLLSKDCRLTGGFAFVAWFGRPEVLLTIGGYHPAFPVPAHYPQVDRVGFNWSVGGGIVVKGGAYFAITHSALMFGGRLEASYDVSPVRVWFFVGLDVMFTWDPFTYDVWLGVGIGVAFSFRICFFACVTIRVKLSLGATVHLMGPPMHGTVTVDLAIASVTVRFGTQQPPPFLTWPEVRERYVLASGPVAPTTVVAGAAPTAGPAPDGARERPLLVQPEFALRVETRMPATRCRLGDRDLPAPPAPPGSTTGGIAPRVEVVPMQGAPPLTPTFTVALRRENDAPVDPARFGAGALATGFPAAQWQSGLDRSPSAPMLRAFSGLEFVVPLTITESSGQLGGALAVPFSSLVDEGVPRRLPLAVVPHGAPARLDGPSDGQPEPEQDPAAAVSAALVADPGRDALAEAPALLRAVVRRATVGPDEALGAGLRTTVLGRSSVPRRRPPGPLGTPGAHLVRPATSGPVSPARSAGAPERAHAPGHGSADTVRAATRAARDGGAVLDPGLLHVWDLAASPAAVRLSGAGAAVLTFLSGGGSVLAELPAAAGDAPVDAPAGATRVVVTTSPGNAASPDAWESTGWDAATPLLVVGRGVLLGPGCQLYATRPLAAPRRGPTERLVNGSWAAAGATGLTTVLSTLPDVVAVTVERRRDSDALGRGDLEVQVEGCTSGPPVVVAQAERWVLLHPVTGHGGSPVVRVASRADWHLAGVAGLRGPLPAWQAALRADPGRRLVDDRVPAGPATLRLHVDEGSSRGDARLGGGSA